MIINELPADIKILSPDKRLDNGCAVAVGSFDGVHLGHRALIERLVSESKKLCVPAVVFTFSAEDGPKSGAGLLAQTELKERLLADSGVDAVILVRFSALRAMPAEQFAEELLFRALGAKSVICGYDFRFGADRRGDASLIGRLLAPAGVSIYACPSVDFGGKPISSTDIRAMISDGRIGRANELLGREFSFSSEVVHGASLGRTLGFPTINQNYPESLVKPRFGVYATVARIGSTLFGGVTDFGVKPTVGGTALPICETYLFGYSGDCYGITVELSFKSFIRDEKRFDSLDLLKARVEADKKAAKQLLN